MKKFASRICVISISDAADEEVLKELYDVYKQMYLLADNGNHFSGLHFWRQKQSGKVCE